MTTQPIVTMELARAVVAKKRAEVRRIRAQDAWRQTARPAQINPDGDWTVWVIMAGRGFGKTRSGAEWVREEVMSGRRMRIAFVGRTEADVRDIMVEGESGILAVCERYKFSAKYQPSRRRVVFGNGAVAMLYSSREPDLLRGPQHDGYWADEVSTWIKPATWSNLMFGMRLSGPLGDGPRGVVTMTPRPTATVLAILKRKGMILTGGTTYENRENLAETFFEEIITDYEGTRLGRQELMGELLNALEGALWNHQQLDELRVDDDETRVFRRVVVAIDPPASDGPSSAECGLIVAGLGMDGHAYVIADRSLHGSPAEWAAAAWAAADEFDADAMVFEINQGGAMVRHTLKTAQPAGKPRRMLAVRATKGKILRAEPVAALYEQKRVHHIGVHARLEDQMCLAGETLVATANGMQRIDRIRAGEMVWTRGGLRPVRWAGQTGDQAAISRVVTEDGREIRATLCHPFYTVERGFIPLWDVAIGDHLEATEWAGVRPESTGRLDDTVSTDHKLSGAAGSGALTVKATSGMRRGSSCTARSGRLHTGRVRRVSKSTTKTRTRRTFHWTTSKQSRGQSTRNGIFAALRRGTPTVGVRHQGAGGRSECPKSVRATTAAAPSPHSVLARNGAPIAVVTRAVASIEPLTERVPVYNLHVAEHHEFYANGILVHNCTFLPEEQAKLRKDETGEGQTSPDRLDAMVYAISNLMLRNTTGYSVSSN